MSHAFYVFGSYGLAAGISLGLALWVYLDGRARQAELKLLEAQGIRRRSQAAATPEPTA
ncbi:hemagglutination activity protein [Rhizobium sp. Root274]|uniref:heme exporter protein CcmD n=1 Tax=unclassified Rhizobium TaxID=2613769 RepID=UPI000712F88B|nr:MULTISPECIES: heme exporter protein CcmD [unclassified Rhizobium]KQW27943.1 hemagglutination activity protein [Rhizobium sp. Root1240]KRD28223.1 hemagglutination activity protein [Rhizobium sp. Root274]